ncbi:GDSL-type esterase/lipase family protein [Kaistia terrae]|uniref:GDSL-type esterase/lipase family protein n=1 Tax=Kaistia terrae TaxID=537017 RepID=A0ABW0Q0J8_9HYPH|nr:GDSL-type esterase/lipase family protein [Kaistia terrae]MCX5578651.1 GDSL-type esterase/lipase family protein [Kaistia terrae]
MATSRKVGLTTCVLLALYLLLSPAYALLNFEAFGSEPRQFIRYIVIPGVLGVLFLATGILAKPDWAAAAGISGLTALLALFACEALLTVQSVPVRLAMLGQLSDEKQETMARDGDFVRGFTLNRLNRMSGTDKLSAALLSGFPNTKVILCTPSDKPVMYTADRYGFNNPNMVYDAPMELMLLGDSFVEGICLPPGQDLASRLRERGLVTAGMGIRGNGPLLELATLGRFGETFRPRHIVMVFFEGNDWENFETELGKPWLREALAPGADYGAQAAASKPMEQARAAMEKASRDQITFVDLLTRTEMLRNFFALQLTLTRLGLVYPKITRTIPEFQDTLRQAKAISTSWGGRFAIAYVPRVDRFLSRRSTDPAFDELRALVLDAAAAEGIQVIDLYEAFRDEAEPIRMYAADSHFSTEGAIVAANVIAQNLASRDHALGAEVEAGRLRR